MRSESLDLCNEELLLVLDVSVQMSHQRTDDGTSQYAGLLTVNCSSVGISENDYE